jgi:hypothetical protein
MDWILFNTLVGFLRDSQPLGHGGAVLGHSIKTRVESVPGVSA